jgi:hypothetical protein
LGKSSRLTGSLLRVRNEHLADAAHDLGMRESASVTPTTRRSASSSILALADAGTQLGSGPWDDVLRSIPGSYLQDGGGEFLVGLLDA